jgi:hypothetical protein
MASTALADGYPNIPALDPYLFGSERLVRTYGFTARNTNATLTLNKTQTMSIPAGDETDEETNASQYYKIIVSARVIVTGEYPLTIGLKNTEGDVISTIEVRDTRYSEDDRIIRDQFVDFEFFVKLNDADVTVQLFMKFGGERHTQKSSGFILFQGYQLTSTYDVAYEKAVNNTKNGAFFYDLETETYKYGATADLSVEKEIGKTTQVATYNFNDTWYLMPSILLGLLIIVAVAGFGIKKLVAVIKANKEKNAPANVEQNPTYTKRIDYSKQTTNDKKEEIEVKDENEANIDEFDEDYDMYAVHDVVDPNKNKTVKEDLPENLSDEEEEKKEETVEETPAEEVEQPKEVKIDKPVSDEFDD